MIASKINWPGEGGGGGEDVLEEVYTDFYTVEV